MEQVTTGQADPRPGAHNAGQQRTSRSLIIPVYKNAENIPTLIEALAQLATEVGEKFEIVFVVDGSPDKSGELLLQARSRLPCPSTIVFHSRNFGAFTAIRTGMEFAAGEHLAVMAADLQEPPELVRSFFAILARDQADVVFGTRTGRADPALRKFFSTAFWALYRKLINPDVPKGGVDIFACNRAVKDAVLKFSEPNSSLVAQLFWVGFRRAYVGYQRRERLHGKSGWGFRRRLRYMMDSIFSYSDIPILFVLWLGVIGCAFSILLAVVTLVARLSGAIVVPGYAGLIIALTFLGSAILATQGVIGCYLWRALENTKKRPLRVISNVVKTEQYRPSP